MVGRMQQLDTLLRKELDSLLRRVVAGDSEAWRSLQTTVEPTIVAIARRHRDLRRKGLAASDDDVREVAVATLERLARDDFRNLRTFLLRSGEQGEIDTDALDDWLYGATDFEIREHLRRRFGRAPKPQDEGAPRPLAKRDLHTLAERIGTAEDHAAFFQTVGVTAQLTAAEIFRYMEGAFAQDELYAMQLHYVEEKSPAEIASLLGLDTEHSATRLIRRLNARLRHRFLASDK